MTRTTIIGALVICLVVPCVWLTANHRWTAFGTPLEYRADSLQMFALARASAEGDYLPLKSKLITRLGAPTVGNWNDYALYEEPLTFLFGRLSNWFGIFAASNLMLLLAHVTTALAFYFVAHRLLLLDETWSIVGALLFSFAYYTAFRGVAHLLLQFNWTVPFVVAGSWAIWKRVDVKHAKWVILLPAFFIGAGNPYWLVMALMLFTLSVLFTRDAEMRWIGIIAMMLMLFGFFVFNMDTIFYAMRHGANPAGMPRVYAQLEMSSLKPVELFMTPDNHRLLGALGASYKSKVWYTGEIFSAYLGVFGIGALAFLIWRSLKVQPLSMAALQVLFIVLFSVLGGFNSFIALAGAPYFRSGNRFSVFILCIVLLYAIYHLSRRKIGLWKLPVALGVLIVGLLDQIPVTPDNRVAVQKQIAEDEAFVAKIENVRPYGKLFCLPLVRYPEGGPVGEVGENDFMRLYIPKSTLRLSYGSDFGRPDTEWQYRLMKGTVPEMLAELRARHCDGIVLDLRGFPSDSQVLSAFNGLPMFTDGSRVFIQL